MTNLVAFIDKLVGTCDKLKSVDVVKFTSNLVSKQPAGTTGRNSPGSDILGIAPHQITECAFVGNLLGTSNDSNLVNSADLRAEAAVHTENSPVDDGSKCHKVKDLGTSFPHRGVAVFLVTLFVESVNLGDLTGFMIAANQCDATWIAGDHNQRQSGQG